MSETPPPLGNQDHRELSPALNAQLLFLCGVGLGTGISAVVWLGYWKVLDHDGAAMIYAISALVALKFGGGVMLLCFRRVRAAGIGLLLALPLGGLMFFIGCAQNFKI